MLLCIDLLEQPTTINSNHFCQFHPFLLVFRQAKITEAFLITLGPGFVHMRKEPVWCYLGEHVEGVTHRLPHTFQSAQRTDGRQHMGRIGSLLATRFDPATLSHLREQEVKQTAFGLMIEQTTAK